MTVTELQEILERHKKWLDNEYGGAQAILREADLREAILSGAILRGADLRGAVLSGADLREADLREADLREAILSGAILRGADLREAELSGADLRVADLRNAELSEAILRGADLDFSCFPLWCGGSQFKCSPELIRQIFAHVATLVCEDADDELKVALDAIKGEAMKSHRASDLGLKG